MLKETLKSLVESDNYFSKESFELTIEKNRYKFDDSYLYTIIDFCENNEIDFEDIKNFISPSLKLKLTNEAINNRQLKSMKKTKDLNTFF